MYFPCKLNLIKLKFSLQGAKVNYIITESFSFDMNNITLKMMKAKESTSVLIVSAVN
jgi:hypothetical protein